MTDLAQAAQDAVTHSGELGGDLVTYIAGGAAMAARIVAPILSIQTERGRRITAIVTSSVFLWAWAFSAYEWSREGVFALLMGYVAIIAATIAMFDLSNPEKLSSAANTLTGGRVGTPKE